MSNLRIRTTVLMATAALALGSCGERPETPPEAEASTSAEPLPIPAEPLPTTPPTAAPSPSGAAAQAIPTRLRAVGTEPFWAARIEGGKLTYMTPDYPEGFTVDAQRRATGSGVEYSGAIDGKPFVMSVTPGTCSDGMSDEVYPFAVTRTIGPDRQKGCARVL